jgi:uncharacterized protein (DUF58 family)
MSVPHAWRWSRSCRRCPAPCEGRGGLTAKDSGVLEAAKITLEVAPPSQKTPARQVHRSDRPHWPLALTRGGVVLLAMAAFVYVAAMSSGTNLLYLAFGILAGALVVSVPAASWSLGRIEIQRDLASHVAAGEASDITYHLLSRKRHWPTMALHFRELHPDLEQAPRGFILHLPAGAAAPATLATRLTPRRRGLLKLDTIEISTTFPFGFLRRAKRLHVPQEIIVYPRIGLLHRHLALQYRESIESGAMTSNRRGGHDEFYGVREYRPGDNVRAIHWRSTARMGELMIREMASNAPPQLVVVLNLRTWRELPDGRARAEHAIELAASLVCYGFFENFAVGLAVAGLNEGAVPPAPRMGHEVRARLLRQLALLNLDDIQPDVGIDFPNRIAGRAEWVIVTLRGDDQARDLLLPGSPPTAAVPGGGGGGGGSSHRTVLALDAPDAASWVQFLSPEETLRILRERTGGPGDAENPAPTAPPARA